MPYTHLLVAVAPTPESQVLIKKAVSIARPVNAKVSLITLATDPELYNQFAAPMMENLREVMQEETREFLNELARHADYPIERMTIACGELGHHIKDFCRSHRVDLVICGNHNGTVAKLAMRQPFVLFKGLTFQKLCLPGAFRPG
ncbi:universal stress protein UspC, partial [Klebsiella pneumoniae]|nr:universal stress protein UspC [Klebsiella pneumoniae]MCN9166186.1 universal stress protein UspC [Klebsiella pneumoniae]MCN9177189.1 universal stress protein UspC [Klebsiella pneumoniae]MCN9183114.1 universal stress protein UspC [Klebsiella pneumoniae]MCN9193987.1 universal stress protein UspC [Klebsiella pneumoniae]